MADRCCPDCSALIDPGDTQCPECGFDVDVEDLAPDPWELCGGGTR